MNARELDDRIRQRALEERCREGVALLNGRFVVSEANKEIVTWILRSLETVTYGDARTPPRSHHHDADDAVGLPTAAQQRIAKEQALAKLSEADKKALGIG